MIKISELEEKLLVSSSNIFNEISNLRIIGAFSLLESEIHRIVDAYYDTEDGFFRKNNGYLRLRSNNADHFITVRLISNEIPNEITHSLSDAGMKLVCDDISTFSSRFLKPDYSKPSFVEILNSLGLFERIRVSNNRIVKKVISENLQFAKMKLDNFCYSNRPDEYYEIEIDIYNSIYREAKDQLVSALQNKYSNYVKRHSDSKYELGMIYSQNK